MKMFKEIAIFLSCIMWFVVFANARNSTHKLRHTDLAKEIEKMKTQHFNEILSLRREMENFKTEVFSQCNMHPIRHSAHVESITRERNEKQTLIWAKKAVNELHVEIMEVAKNVNSTALLHHLHHLRNSVNRVISENANILKLGRVLEARLDKMDSHVESLKYENKNMEIIIGEFRQELAAVNNEVKQKIVEQEEALNDVAGQKSAQNVSGSVHSEKNRKYRHNKMIHKQISRLAESQNQLDANQQKLENKIVDQQHRLDRLEEPNWNLISAKIDLLDLEMKVFSDRLNNNTQAVSNVDKMHVSMLELRENLEAMENKIDKTIPEFRKEISKLDVCEAQTNAHISYLKEDQENLRQSVKAIAFSMSNAQDRAEQDRMVVKKISNAVDNLTSQSKKHYHRLNDHIMKSEANVVVSETNLTEVISLPQLMEEVKELQPVEREYEDLIVQLPKDCTGISGPPGTYIVRPNQVTIDAWCNNGTTLAQRRYNGSVEFNRKFAEYVRGFGDPAGEYWIGLETLHQLTVDNCTSMRIDMTDIYGAFWYAQYENFFVGSADTGYLLVVNGFNGNASDAFEYQNHMEFSAIDRDRDISNTNCAVNYEGGWWFSHCQHVNINGKYTLGLTWFDSTRNEWIAVATTEMRIFRRPGCF